MIEGAQSLRDTLPDSKSSFRDTFTIGVSVGGNSEIDVDFHEISEDDLRGYLKVYTLS